MRYYVVNQSYRIVEVFPSLRELKESLPEDLELMDFIDDLAKPLGNGNYILTENLLNDYLKKQVEESESHNTKNTMELRLEVTDLKEKLDETYEEIESVHSEVVALETDLDTKNVEIDKLEKVKETLETSVSDLTNDVSEKEATIEKAINNRVATVLPKINKAMVRISEELAMEEEVVARLYRGMKDE